MKTKIELQDLEECESCEGLFDPEKMERNGDETFCENCLDGIMAEIKSQGIKNIDEYLKSRNLESDFHLFCRSKFSGVSEEELKEMEGY